MVKRKADLSGVTQRFREYSTKSSQNVHKRGVVYTLTYRLTQGGSFREGRCGEELGVLLLLCLGLWVYSLLDFQDCTFQIGAGIDITGYLFMTVGNGRVVPATQLFANLSQ